MSFGHEAYCQARDSYDPRRGKFTTWLHFKVTQKVRQELWRRKRNKSISTVPIHPLYPERTHWLDTLGDDASLLVRTALDLPFDVRVLLGGVPRHWQVWGAIKQSLLDLGWSKERIKDGYEEVRKALSS